MGDEATAGVMAVPAEAIGAAGDLLGVFLGEATGWVAAGAADGEDADALGT